MTTLEVLGYVGGVFVFSTFYLKTMIPLRLVAIASNIVYIAYSALAGLRAYPGAAYHCCCR